MRELRTHFVPRPWLDEGERWHGELTVGDEDDEEALEAVVFCPACSAREFGRP